MRVPPRSAALLVVVAAAAALEATVVARGRDTAQSTPPVSWLGLVGGPRAPVPNGQRMIVVLNTPSVAQRLARVRYATEAQERSWSSQALAAQSQVLTTLAAQGVSVRPEFTYSRVLNGFAAALDGRAVALLNQMGEVAGVYPVRAAYPASISETVVASKQFDDSSGHRPSGGIAGYDGRGVTIGLLDTGVDQAHPYLRGKVLPGIDVLDPAGDATPKPDPQNPSELERHGTELAGILVGAGGPGGLHGVAPGAQVLPIRIAGWQAGSDGKDLIYARSDQLIEGLDRAVDPNGDGDAHDAVRVAVLGVAEPYAAFTDSPEAMAVQGALDLNTVVVAPAGNDGGAGPAFGSVAGPAGGAGAVAVGATDSRREQPRVRVVLRRGLDVILDEHLPLLGASEPTHAMTLRAATPRSTRGLAGSSSADFFDRHGLSLVAGRAAIVPVGEDPQATAIAASRAGASAVILYGDSLPPGALRVAEAETAPVVVVPTAAASELLAARRAGVDVGVAIGSVSNDANGTFGHVAGFSSQGLAFDGSIKPDVVAPGVAIATAEPGSANDGSPLYGTINGTSAAAATVGGAAAVIAEMRPSLDGPALQSVLVGYAQRGRASAYAVGAGVFRSGAAAVGEVAAQPTTLGFGIWGGPRWHATRTIVVRNVSTRRLQLSLKAVTDGESEALTFKVVPDHVVLGIGRSKRVRITVTAPAAVGGNAVTGAIQVSAAGSQTLRVPWALGFRQYSANLLARVSLDRSSFKASDTAPALLTIQAGNLVRDRGLQVQPVSRLDILLYSANGEFLGALARLRNLLPGAYSFGITGRGPTSVRLAPGRYELRLAAWPTLPRNAKPSRAQVRFTIQ